MTNLQYKLILMLGLLLPAGFLYAQPDGVDERARELVSLAKKYYQSDKFLDAGLTFELATQRPENRLTTMAWYMSGLSFYRINEKEKATEAFEKLISNWPQSKYIEEARFHKALMLMESTKTNDREQGLDKMFRLMDETESGELYTDCKSTVQHFLFEVYDQVFLNLYYLFVDEIYKPWIVEAMVGQFDKKGEGYLVLDKLKDYEAKDGELTNYMQSLRDKYESGKKLHDNRLNIAVFLSFNLHLLDTARKVPVLSKRALGLYEGMKMALDSSGGDLAKRINVRFFDTQRDTGRVSSFLDSLDHFGPDIIIGDIRTSLAAEISKWAEKHKVVHLIPLNALNALIRNKKYTFLTHPSLNTHGKEMAKFLIERENKRKILVFNDKSYFSARFAKSFLSQADSFPEVSTVEKVISQDYETLRDDMIKYAKTLKYQAYDAIYIPLSSEEAAGMIISQLNYHKIKTMVVGGPDWEMFSVIDSDVKTAYDLQYSTFYHDKNDSLAFDDLRENCLREYGAIPSKYTVQGFDIMSWLLTISKGMNAFNSPLDVIHSSQKYHGIHQDFYFGDYQDNQKINVVNYKNGRIEKVNRDWKKQGTVPGGMPGDPGRG